MIHTGGREARWASLEAHLAAEILGQNEATRTLARALLRGEMNFVEPGRPRSFQLLLGETGVGKTESVLAAARHLFGNTDVVVRLDMAEYAERGPALARLLGSGPDDPGLLGAALVRARLAREGRPGGLFLLLDEIEKAHPDVTRLFLGMEAARLTTADGIVHDLADVHVLCTSNLGSEAARGLSGSVPVASVRRVVEEEARAHFGSAVMARFTEIVVYRGLDYNLQREICRQKLERKCDYLRTQLRRDLVVDEGVLDHVLRRGWHRDLGARHLRHAIDRELGDAAVRYALAFCDRPDEGPLRIVLAGERLELCRIGISAPQ